LRRVQLEQSQRKEEEERAEELRAEEQSRSVVFTCRDSTTLYLQCRPSASD
jgi:uncharacterized metal-binding protein YceD (DUF177 family)